MGHNWGLNRKICQFEFSDALWTPRFLKPTMVTHLLHLSIQSHGHQVLVCWVNSRCAHAILCLKLQSAEEMTTLASSAHTAPSGLCSWSPVRW